MNTIENIATELFSKIRSRFSNLKLGDEDGAVTTEYDKARFFEFDFESGGKVFGRINIKLSTDSLVIIYPSSILGQISGSTKEEWFDFTREMRQFARRNMLRFDSRDITKDNLNVRDYSHLVKNESVLEAKESNTHREKLGTSKIIVKKIHEDGRNKIKDIFIESPTGERFKYPHKLLSGARAMARHISNEGSTYDDIGKSIIEMSSEIASLRRFKRRSAKVMNEDMSSITTVIENRIDELKRTLSSLKGLRGYMNYVGGYVQNPLDTVPTEIADSWVGQIGSDSEDLRECFPYVYRAVRESSKISFGKLAESLDIKLNKEEYMPGREEVNDFILSFYDKMTRTFPRGKTNVVLSVEKKYGDRAAKYARVAVDKLSSRM